jgi:xanthine dehydrogenase small subunit
MDLARDQASFLLNGAHHNVPRSVPPTRTLLDYLREDLHLTGTKEGCNEGDCGACTVVVSGPDGVARAVNACIQFVPMVDGLSVTTVEGLRGPNGKLHPVQQAMVDCHGSQCGFCTPGFVMSLYATYLSFEREEVQIDDILAGNLCRCTGYGPIVAAAKRALAQRTVTLAATEGSPTFGQPQPASDDLPAALAPLALDHTEGRFFAPTTIDELADLYERYPQATILAGATDVGLWVTKQHRRLPVVISTARVDGLSHLSSGAQDRRLRIFAGVTYAAAHAALGTSAAILPTVRQSAIWRLR